MKKKIYIQILGVIACLAVVAMHVNGCFWQFSYDRYWITANIIECICYFAVPIFFMISGATLLNYRKRYTTAVFFKKRFGKTLVPFLIWSVISAIWYYIVYHARPEGIREVVDGILNTRYVDIYWFLLFLFLQTDNLLIQIYNFLFLSLISIGRNITENNIFDTILINFFL